MKATKLLEKDHEKVKALFKDYAKAGDRAYQKKQELFNQIKEELEIHSQVEEEVFYPAVMRIRSQEVKELIQEAIEEHHQVKRLLEELTLMQPEEAQFDAKVTVLREDLEHHIEEEEEELFELVNDHLSDDLHEELGSEMEMLKSTLKEEAV